MATMGRGRCALGRGGDPLCGVAGAEMSNTSEGSLDERPHQGGRTKSA